MTQIINGKEIAQKVQSSIYKEIQTGLKRKPGLAFVLVGNDLASHTYIKMKKKACMEIGFHSIDYILEDSISEKDLLKIIQNLNQDPKIDGILVQLPLPQSINTTRILLQIDPDKDVDGFHPTNMGKLLLGDDTGFIPCTPYGIHFLLQKSSIEIEGKHIVIVGRSNIVGKPLAALLMQKKKHCNATVSIAHSQTKNLKELTKSADILIVAMGKAQFIDDKYVKKGTVVIDVGINRDHGKIVGDVNFEKVAPLASYITPVPKGVGPMTIAMLMQNTYLSFKKRIGS